MVSLNFLGIWPSDIQTKLEKYNVLQMSNALSRSTNVTTLTCHGPSVTHPEEAVTPMSFLVMQMGVMELSDLLGVYIRHISL